MDTRCRAILVLSVVLKLAKGSSTDRLLLGKYPTVSLCIYCNLSDAHRMMFKHVGVGSAYRSGIVVLDLGPIGYLRSVLQRWEKYWEERGVSSIQVWRLLGLLLSMLLHIRIQLQHIMRADIHHKYQMILSTAICINSFSDSESIHTVKFARYLLSMEQKRLC